MSSPVSTVSQTLPRIVPRTAPPQASGVRRYVLMVCGWFFVCIAALGAALPGIPTTPWLLCAAYCFDRSSERFSKWLRNAPIFGKLIADWERYRGVRPRVKVMAVCTIVTVVSCSILFFGLPTLARWIIGAWACIGVTVMVFVVPTVRNIPDE